MRRHCLLIAVFLALFSANAFAWFSFNLDQPLERLAGNSVVDIVYQGGYVWLGTGSGLSGTADRGLTWRTYDETNGLSTSSISGCRLFKALVIAKLFTPATLFPGRSRKPRISWLPLLTTMIVG